MATEEPPLSITKLIQQVSHQVTSVRSHTVLGVMRNLKMGKTNPHLEESSLGEALVESL